MADTLSTQPYKGTRDFFPEEFAKLQYIFETWRAVAVRFGYEEYLSPLLEDWQMYAAKNVSGEEIVNEQLYWFTDHADRKVAIRPEMTPSVSRMVAAKVKELPKPLRWFSIANFMRYEKPQRGRVREFFQLNLDLFGEDAVTADAEVIEVAIAIMQEFGATNEMFEIQVNNRQWFDYWVQEVLSFSGDTKKLSRIVDRVAKQTPEETASQLQEIGLNDEQIALVQQLSSLTIKDLESMQDKSTGAQTLIQLFSLLEERNLLPFVRFNAALVRGLDYYTGNVFEQFDLHPENNRSMFGGGRYDGLVSMFGGDPIPAVGLAPGDVTTNLFLENWNLYPDFSTSADVLVTIFNPSLQHNSWQVAHLLREQGLWVELFSNPDEKLNNQLSYANRKGVQYVVIIGSDEVEKNEIVIKNLEDGSQKSVSLADPSTLISFFEL